MINPQQQQQVDAIKAKYSYKPPQQQGQADWFTATTPKPAPAAAPTFSSVGGAIGEDFNKRNQSIGESKARYQAGKESLPSTLLHGVGQAAGFGSDIIGEVVSSAIKPEAKQAIGDTLHPIIEKAKSSPQGQGVLNWWADFSEKNPEAAQNLEDTGEIALLLSNAVGFGGAAKGAQAGVKIAESTIPKVVAPATEAATKTVQGVKDVATSAKAAVTPSRKAFQDVYTSQAQSSKYLNKALDKTTVTQEGAKVSPIHTIESYTATPKVVNKTGGGHALDFSAIKDEAKANVQSIGKDIDSKVVSIKTLTPKNKVLGEGLTAAASDKNLMRTGDVPGVKRAMKQLFNDYGIKGETITAKQLNELRKGANEISNSYYEAQKTAGVAGTISKTVSDRAEAAVVLGKIFKEQLGSLDESIKPMLAKQALHINAGRYASAAHLSPVGVSGSTRAAIDTGGAAAGAVGGALLGGPIGAGVGAGLGAGLTEKAQAMLLRRTYEGAPK